MITVNRRTYRLRDKPIVFVCLDGTAPKYLEAARSVMPNLQRIRAAGAEGIANSVIPSFTNPNNVALVTGVPPATNGISGNFYYDRAQDREVMMNDAVHLRCPTILSAFSRAGKSVAAVTTKDKLRKLLAKDLAGICFSIEGADEATEAENGISGIPEKIGRASPGIYDPDCSVYCLEAGNWLLRKRRPDLLYLSTTDYVQHKYAPDTPAAKSFYAKVDQVLGRINDQDVILGITADHGMNEKTREDGSPRVEFLESLLIEKGVKDVRVILPITDPYVVHHGALGSFATIYLQNGQLETVRRWLQEVPGIELVLTREEAQARFALPGDHIGELVVLADRHTVLGRTPEWHDLSSVQQGLRSHGGLHERRVPFIVNRSLTGGYARNLQNGSINNFDLLDFLCNGTLD